VPRAPRRAGYGGRARTVLRGPIAGIGSARHPTANERTHPADRPFNPANVIAVGFTGDSNAYEALTQIKELASQGQISRQGAAVVARADDGKIVEKATLGDGDWAGTASKRSSAWSSGSSAVPSGS
jgi:hypothetical protein